MHLLFHLHCIHTDSQTFVSVPFPSSLLVLLFALQDQYAALKAANPGLKFIEISALVAAAYRKQKSTSS